jgi:uroporphyrin-III C-methyltransferase/precorrin-2 dehydrogenase/sirohydrochlorin ferrochelatase/uroporphyrin-III C-methyltransferase
MNGLTRVALVGAGPGDPDLLTLKAARLIGDCDVVVYDRLVSAAILAMIPAGTTRIFAGKIARGHYIPQDDINDHLVRLARAGHRVVRLKGGDPFVFGRGGEEAEHLARHGIAFEVVPGITAATGCSAYAGIPLTHRGLATGVRIVTGHLREGSDLDADWRALADPDATLVVYMGRTNADRLSRCLIAAGLSADTPAAIIYEGTLPTQRTVLTTLAGLPARLADADRAVPTLLIIGRVAALARDLHWRDALLEEVRSRDSSHG